MTVTDFRKNARALIVGGSGGIGAALADEVRASGHFATVLTSGRRRGDIRIDLTDPQSIASGIDEAGQGGLDCVLVASGILHEEEIEPEKSVRALQAEHFARVLQVNTVGPAMVLRHVTSHLPRRDRALVAALSARVGSISDNRLGGWISYRASKAALNQVIRTVSVEWARTHREAVLVGLHPGTVDTALSLPFQTHVPDGKLFTPQHSAAQMWQVLMGLSPSDTGKCFDYAGKEVPA